MTNWYKEAQGIPLDPLADTGGLPIDPMSPPGVSPLAPSGALGEPEESIQEVIKKANKLLRFFMKEDKEDSKDALMRVSRFLGSKYSPRLWIVDYTVNPPKIVDYDGIPLGDWEQKELAEKELSNDSGGGLFG
tara:strand:- start:302 stop:700 length:399 start_codon:yes stop_codon:yes gene_type:complete